MKHEFPIISHINDVLPHLEGFDEFKVMVKDGYQVVLYKMQISSSFGNTETLDVTEGELIRRECRGLTFDMDGNLIGRKFHKFFNVGERLETMTSNVDLSEPHIILEKLDGSMITPMYINEELQWHTKAGNTDIGKMAGKFVKRAVEVAYDPFATRCDFLGYTAMFEYCSRNNRIVLDYQKEQLILTAIRINETGEYLQYNEMVDFASRYDVPVVDVYKSDDENISTLLNDIAGKTGIEGIVLRFDNGHMCKIKCDEYILFHRTVSAIGQEKNLWRLVAENKIDDIKSALADDIRVDVEKFELKLQKEIVSVNKEICDTISKWVSENKTSTANPEGDGEPVVTELTPREISKKFAAEVVPKADKRLASIYFGIRNRALQPMGVIDPNNLPETKSGDPFVPVEPYDAVANFIVDNSKTNIKIEEIRDLFGNIKWSMVGVEDAE